MVFMYKFDSQKIQHTIQLSKGFTNLMDYDNTLWKVNNDLFIYVVRHPKKWDINGNAIYKVVIMDGEKNILNANYKKHFKRTYKEHSIIQSFGLSLLGDLLCRMINEGV